MIIIVSGCVDRPKADIALSLCVMHLFPDQIRLQTQHPRYTDHGKAKEDDLDSGLPRKEWVLHDARREEHVDEHVEQTRRLSVRLGPVGEPLDDDADHEVSEERLHEEDLGNEFCPDAGARIEVNEVGDLEADGKRHLRNTLEKQRRR